MHLGVQDEWMGQQEGCSLEISLFLKTSLPDASSNCLVLTYPMGTRLSLSLGRNLYKCLSTSASTFFIIPLSFVALIWNGMDFNQDGT